MSGLGFFAVGCTWTSDAGVGERFVSAEPVVVESAPASWEGEPIDVYDRHGTIVVVGVPGKTNLTVRARLVAGGRSQSEVDAAFADVADQIKVTRDNGRWTVRCGQALAWHGSVDPETTGCTELWVEVPAGSLAQPIELTARADFGGVHVSGVTVDSLTATAPFGLVADVVPAPDAAVSMRGDDLLSGFCSTILRVPADTSVRSLSLRSEHADLEMNGVDPGDRRWWGGVEIEHPGFGEAIAPRTPAWAGRIDAPGTPMASVELYADIGKAVFGTAPVPAPKDLGNCREVDPARASVTF